MAAERVWIHVTDSNGGMEEEIEPACASCCPVGLALFAGYPAIVQADAVAGAGKLELHRVLNAFQNSPDFGIHVCEQFRDPRKYVLDQYWDEVSLEAFSIHDLRHAVGGIEAPLTDDARARLHQFSRVLERLSKRIDHVVLA